VMKRSWLHRAMICLLNKCLEHVCPWMFPHGFASVSIELMKRLWFHREERKSLQNTGINSSTHIHQFQMQKT